MSPGAPSLHILQVPVRRQQNNRLSLTLEPKYNYNPVSTVSDVCSVRDILHLTQLFTAVWSMEGVVVADLRTTA